MMKKSYILRILISFLVISPKLYAQVECPCDFESVPKTTGCWTEPFEGQDPSYVEDFLTGLVVCRTQGLVVLSLESVEGFVYLVIVPALILCLSLTLCRSCVRFLLHRHAPELSLPVTSCLFTVMLPYTVVEVVVRLCLGLLSSFSWRLGFWRIGWT